MRTLRFGLLGSGYWADTVHAPGLAAHPRVELAGVWARDPDKASRVAERHGTVAEPDLDALLERVDGVAIAVPPDAQAVLACQAADAGCHLLLEKPLALSTEAAGRVVAAVERASVASLVFFTQHFAEPTAGWLQEVVARGEWHGGCVRALGSILDPSNPFAQSLWRHEHGALWDVGPHSLSVLLPALGPVEEVAAERGHGDTVHLALRHRKGGVSSATVSLTAPDRMVHGTLELWGPSGVVRPPAGNASLPADAYARALTELIGAVEQDTGHACDVRLGAEVVQALEAAERFLARARDDRGERPAVVA